MADRAALEAVVFDAGGTLIRLDFEWMSATVSALGSPLGPDALRRGEIGGRRRFDAARRSPLSAWTHATDDAIAEDTRAYFGGMLEAAGVPARVAAGALPRFTARQRAGGLWTRPVEGARATIDTLAAAGLRLACVSNSDGRAEHHLAECGLLAGLEFVVDSHVEGVEKPDPEIFRIALRRLGLAPERALYVGDIRSVDEAGAGAAGMHFVLIDPWGDYGAPGGPAIAAIADLPGWIGGRFAISGAGAARSTANTPGPSPDADGRRGA
jgi:putative hydrolase of the HAD superfamily